MIAIGDLHLYNDTPIIEEGDWKLLVPTKWAVKWRHLSDTPIVIHICQECPCCDKETIYSSRELIDGPRCDHCNQDIPEGIQALWQLTHEQEMQQ
jgi:hypothetical protein